MSATTWQEAREIMHTFHTLRKDEQEGRYEQAAHHFADFMANGTDERVFLLAVAGALATAEVLRSTLDLPEHHLFVLACDPSEIEGMTTSGVAAWQVLVGTLNEDGDLVSDVLTAHATQEGPDGVVQVIRTFMAFYSSLESEVHS